MQEQTGRCYQSFQTILLLIIVQVYKFYGKLEKLKKAKFSITTENKKK